MGFDGYLSIGGVEIINAQRTAAYVENLSPSMPFMHRTDRYQTIATALGDEAYRTPALDGADWVENDPATDPVQRNPTHGFYGLYPLSIEGLGDSTMAAEVIQGILDGGFINSARDATAEIRVRALALGDSKLAVEHGLVWLRSALRGNACGMHGDGCGYADLRYFLAPPEVCDPSWDPKVGIEDLKQEDYQTVDAGSSPVIFIPDGGPTRPLPTASWSWSSFDDGVLVEWGLLGYDDSTPIASITRLTSRKNYVLNPSFTPDAVTWSQLDSDGGTPAPQHRVAAPRAFARFAQDLGVVRANYLPDPSFEGGSPATFGWRSSTAGGVQAVEDVTAPYGTHVAVVAGVPGQTELEVTVLGPADPGRVILSFVAAQNADDIVLEILNNEGAVIETTTFDGLTNPWNGRGYLTTANVQVGYVLRLTTAGTQELRVDGLLLTDQGSSDSFFDGDSGVGYGFRGGRAGLSYFHEHAIDSATLFNDTMTTKPGAATLGVELRAPIFPSTVTIRMVASDGTLVSSSTVQPAQTWQRFVLGTTYGRAIHLEFEADGIVDIDNVIVESGDVAYPYFDGDFPSTPYEGLGFPEQFLAPQIEWINPDTNGNPDLNTPSRSVSYMTFLLPTFFSPNENARPYLKVLSSNSLSVVRLIYSQGTEIPMSVQLEPYDRTLHDVGVTVGAKKIREYELTSGAATEIDFVITAANPHPFSTQSETIDFDPVSNLRFEDNWMNLVPNPSARVSTAGFVATAGTGGVAAMSTQTVTGQTVARATWTTASTAAGGGMHIDVPLEGGAIYFGGIGWLRSSINQRVRIQFEWFNGATLISTQGAGDYELTAGVSLSLGGTVLNAPSTATKVRINVFTVAGAGYANWSIGSYLELSRLMVNYGSSFHSAYFDGDTPDTDTWSYEWTGAIGLSPSRRIVTPDTQVVVVDPDLPAMPSPPAPPQIPDQSYGIQNQWTRYYVEIPSGNVAEWASTIPTIVLNTKASEIRQVRVRFFPNPFGWPATKVDPESFCGEFILSYLPANSELTVSGVSEEAWVSVAGGPVQTANHLLYGQDGGPMEWPELSCQLPYLMTVDISPSSNLSNLEIDLWVNRRE